MRNRFCKLIRDVASGQEASSHVGVLPRVLRSEEGMMTWATLVAVVCFTALIAMVFNVGRIANDKLEAQNAADSSAYSASLVQARAMNAVTASNHMMGELTALYTMHHAIGGDALDESESYSTFISTILNVGVFGTWAGAWVTYGIAAIEPALVPFLGLGSPPTSYGPADDTPKGEASVHDAKMLLKAKIIEQYINHIMASLDIIEGKALTLSIWPPTVAAGFAKVAEGELDRFNANQEIDRLVREYRFINSLESFAIRTKPIKRNIIPGLLEALWAYEQLVVTGTRVQAGRAASTAAERNMSVGEVLGRPTAANVALALGGIPSATLPVVRDPTEDDEKSQLMRATYPWVQVWRSPLLILFDARAFKSRFARFYEYHCDKYSKEICQEFREERGFELYVLEEMDADNANTDKGTESWRERDQSGYADRLFSVVGVARADEAPRMSHMAFWPNPNPTPIAAISQAMIYNGNRPVEWEAGTLDAVYFLLGREAQPVDGWDTLNWTEGATEWKEGKVYFNLLPDDFDWLLGYLVFLDVPFVYPPDLKIPDLLFGGGGPPTPRIQLNWQAKLTPIAPRNLLLRLAMTRDSDLRERMQSQVTFGIAAQELGVDVINH